MNIYTTYLDEIETRKIQGLHPKPIEDAELVDALVAQILDPAHEHRADSLNFFIYNVLPGTTSAAGAKSRFLKEIILGTHKVEEISPEYDSILKDIIAILHKVSIHQALENSTDNRVIDIAKKIDKEFMLLCGFEKFDKFFVRIDILERLFILILNSNKEKNNEIKLIPEMLNLLGSNKENFIKLLQRMGYKTFKKDNDIYFKYILNKKIVKKESKRVDKINNPFGILSQLNLK